MSKAVDYIFSDERKDRERESPLLILVGFNLSFPNHSNSKHLILSNCEIKNPQTSTEPRGQSWHALYSKCIYSETVDLESLN